MANLIRLRFAEQDNYPPKHLPRHGTTTAERTHSGYLTRRHACFCSIMPMLYRSLPVSDGSYYPGGMSADARMALVFWVRPFEPESGASGCLAHEMGCNVELARARALASAHTHTHTHVIRLRLRTRHKSPAVQRIANNGIDYTKCHSAHTKCA